MRRLYKDGKTCPFSVRVHEQEAAKVARLAQRLGISEVEAKREIFSAGLKALQAA